MTGEVRCLDLRTGETLWSVEGVEGERLLRSAVVFAGDGIVVTLPSGEVHAFRLADGSTAWTRRMEGTIKGLGTHEGVLYVGTSQGRVYALQFPEPERAAWDTDPPSAGSPTEVD